MEHNIPPHQVSNDGHSGGVDSSEGNPSSERTDVIQTGTALGEIKEHAAASTSSHSSLVAEKICDDKEEILVSGKPTSGEGNTLEQESTPSRDNSGESMIDPGNNGREQMMSKDAYTNTLMGSKHFLVMINEAGTIGNEHTMEKHIETEIPKSVKGLIAYHNTVFDSLPSLRVFLFCVRLRYGVYSIISAEVIYFSLRAYTRVLHLAMPYFFPQLRTWVVTTELLLCLLILASDVIFLYGAFYNPFYLYIWIDIHVLEILAYIGLIISLAVTNSECILECSLIFSSYLMGFLYFILIVNTFRSHWVPPEPSDDGNEPSDL